MSSLYIYISMLALRKYTHVISEPGGMKLLLEQPSCCCSLAFHHIVEPGCRDGRCVYTLLVIICCYWFIFKRLLLDIIAWTSNKYAVIAHKKQECFSWLAMLGLWINNLSTHTSFFKCIFLFTIENTQNEWPHLQSHQLDMKAFAGINAALFSDLVKQMDPGCRV